jgi:DNA (cytosine-5)-methyltransferase 1
VYLLSVFDTAIASRCPDKVLPVNEGSSGDLKKSLKQQGQEAAREVADCLRSGGEGGVPLSRGENLVVEPKAIILDATRVNNVRTYEDDIAPCLTRRMGTGGNTVPMVSPQPITNVRRLTPLECERLMGWPDNHTLNRADGKINSDSARYRMCGNGVASPVVKWVIDQIKEI